jgi:hypothetical protein
MARAKRLTPKMLRKLVFEEKKRMLEDFGAEESIEKVAKDTEEVEADDLADSIEKDIDWMKALKIQEAKLRRRLRRVNETKKRLRRRVIKKLN